MSKPLTIPQDRKQKLLDKLLDRCEALLDSGGSREAIDAAKVLLPHLLPAPKTVSQQVLVASAGDGGRTEATTKARLRLTQAGPDITDATFTPLARVQKDE